MANIWTQGISGRANFMHVRTLFHDRSANDGTSLAFCLYCLDETIGETRTLRWFKFVGRPGKSNNIYSDNATNFVGTNNEIKILNKLINYDQGIAKSK